MNPGTSFETGPRYRPFGDKVMPTRPRLSLLLKMYSSGKDRVHHVSDLGFRLPVMLALKAAGMVETTDPYNSSAPWRGRLTKLGKETVRNILHRTGP